MKKKAKIAVVKISNSNTIINSFLLAAVVALASYYVIGANGITSSNYLIKILKDKLTQINEERSVLLSQKAGLEDSLITLEFAKANNMVEAKNISYIFENGSVALRR